MFNWVNDVINWIGDVLDGDDSGFNSRGSTRLNTKVKVNGVDYPVFKDGSGNYYYRDTTNNVYKKITNKDLYSDFEANKSKTVDITKKVNEVVNPWTPEGQKQQKEQGQKTIEDSTIHQNNVSNTTYNTGGTGSGGYGGSDFWKGMYDSQVNVNNELINRIENLENPKVLSAEEVANILGIDYNEQNILNDYNKATNEYYDAAIDELNDIRQTYDRNNAMYYDQIMDSYLDSYKNMAPTASGKGALAATALSNMFASQQTNAAADYDVIQDILLNEKGREKELANNPNLAKKQYNDLGIAMSGLSADFNRSATQQYINKLNAYTNEYAANQSYRSQLANAQATKYSGLANAAATNASAYATRYNNSFTPYYNYYANRFGSNVADNYVANLIRSGSGGY